MATTEFIAAIELGSSKITGVAGKKNSDGSMKILAYAQEDSSQFIRKGVVYNLDKTSQSLTSIINRLEGELQNSIGKVYVAIGGQSLRTIRNVISRDLEEGTIISEELVSSIGDENIAIPLIDMDILDVAPQEYKIGNNLQADPVGVAGNHIEGRFLNIIARSTVKKNLERCFEQARIDIVDLFIAPLITADAILTETERRSGCALIDFGADTTTVSIYKNNILRFLSVIPLGGHNITKDIVSLQMEEEEAEELKIIYGDVSYEEEASEEPALCMVDDDNRTFELNKLNAIIAARAEEIIANVFYQIQQSGYDDKLLSGIVMTGGGANLRHLDDMLRKRSKIEKIRIAKFIRHQIDAPLNIIKKDGTQNTVLGLLFEGTQNCCLTEKMPREKEIEMEEVEYDDPTSFETDETPYSLSHTQDMFEDDEELRKESERIRREREEREEQEKAAKAAAKAARDADKLQKAIDKKARKANAGPSWIERLTKDFFSDDKME